jgi:hypothetical protein
VIFFLQPSSRSSDACENVLQVHRFQLSRALLEICINVYHAPWKITAARSSPSPRPAAFGPIPAAVFPSEDVQGIHNQTQSMRKPRETVRKHTQTIRRSRFAVCIILYHFLPNQYPYRFVPLPGNAGVLRRLLSLSAGEDAAFPGDVSFCVIAPSIHLHDPLAH